jgi:prepilin signal peptidase PulO-like enzyme (type II secretory pathway)
LACFVLVFAALAAFLDQRMTRFPLWLFAIGVESVVLSSRPDEAILGALVCTGVLALDSRKFGGGDYKLIAVIGALLGPERGLCATLIALIVASILPPKIHRPFASCVLAGAALVEAASWLT